MSTPNFHNLEAAKKYELAQKLGTTKGFYLYYFDMLPNFTTNVDCFNAVNLLHVKIFNEEKYADYNSFRNALRYHLTVKK